MIFFFCTCLPPSPPPYRLLKIGNSMKKCRARYGLDQQNQWCKPCRWVSTDTNDFTKFLRYKALWFFWFFMIYLSMNGGRFIRLWLHEWSLIESHLWHKPWSFLKRGWWMLLISIISLESHILHTHLSKLIAKIFSISHSIPHFLITCIVA